MLVNRAFRTKHANKEVLLLINGKITSPKVLPESLLSWEGQLVVNCSYSSDIIEGHKPKEKLRKVPIHNQAKVGAEIRKLIQEKYMVKLDKCTRDHLENSGVVQLLEPELSFQSASSGRSDQKTHG